MDTVKYHQIYLTPVASTPPGTAGANLAVYVINVDAGSPLQDANVTISGGSSKSTSASGLAFFDNITVSYLFTATASKDGYTTTSGTKQTGVTGSIAYLNLYTYASSNTSPGGTSGILGHVYSNVDMSAISSATIHISNLTWSTTTTSSSSGLYKFTDLTPESTYTVYSTKTGWAASDNESVTTGTAGKFETQDLYMDTTTLPQATIAGYVRDITTGSIISGVTVRIDTTHVYTTNASGFYRLDYLNASTQFNVSVSKTGYSSDSAFVTTGGADTITYKQFYLNPASTGTPGEAKLAVYYINIDSSTGVQGATIDLSNNASKTSSTSGLGFFEDLEINTLYTATGKKTGFITVSDSKTTGGDGTVSYLNLMTYPSDSSHTIGTTAVGGYVNNAATLAAISNATVTISNATWSSSNTTSTSGVYLFQYLPITSTYTLAVSKTNFTSETASVTTGGQESFTTKNFYLTPTGSQSYTGTAIAGLVLDLNTGTAIPDATVIITGIGYSESTTSSSSGYFKFERLTAVTSYSLAVSKSGYTTATESVVTGAQDSITYQNVYMSGTYTVTVRVKDLVSNALISDLVTVECSDGEVEFTTNGVTTFELNYGSYSFTASCAGYYETTQDSTVTSDKTVTIYLQPIVTPTATPSGNVNASSGMGTGYPAHNVRFLFTNLGGTPCKYLNITATPMSSSGPWAWITDIVGISTATPQPNATVLTGMSGSDGAWAAMMIETIKYDLHVWNATRGIDFTVSLYPREDEYSYIITEGEGPAEYDNILWNLSVVDVNATHVRLQCSYTDLLSHTSSCRFTVKNGAGTTVYTTLCSGPNNCTANYTCSNTKGDSYNWGFAAESSDFGTIEHWNGITMEGPTGKLVDLGISPIWYSLISLALLGMCGAFFSSKMNPHGAIVVAIMGAVLWWIGWLPITGLLVALAIVLAVFYYMENKEERHAV